jgi:hypothetical protein
MARSSNNSIVPVGHLTGQAEVNPIPETVNLLDGYNTAEATPRHPESWRVA